MDVLGFILAGGQSRRMGGEHKFLHDIGGKPLLQYVVDRARPQCQEIVLNCNDPALEGKDFGLSVVRDQWPGGEGPLAGILTGLHFMRHHNADYTWLMTFAADTPLFPRDCVIQLQDQAVKTGRQVVLCYSQGRSYPVMGLWHKAAYEPLLELFINGKERRPHIAAKQLEATYVDFTGPAGSVDPFFNLNRPEDMDIIVQELSPQGV
ncbi:MAG: molybdenum cofactor guanylyltransferase [Kordiimonas sp.]|nr:molybdenum cofactor guanylyltransferase [Kordiimonas sp.]|tara:strand:+ start:6124 stop:6744 length:621 start_codon:yes stop_codon:yes gene_type:complete